MGEAVGMVLDAICEARQEIARATDNRTRREWAEVLGMYEGAAQLLRRGDTLSQQLRPKPARRDE